MGAGVSDEQLLELLTGLRDEIVSLREELRVKTEARPVIGSTAAAELLGVDRKTVDRVIANLPPSRRPAVAGVGAQRSRPWWPDPEACREWWAAATRPAGVAVERRPRAVKAGRTTGAVDWSKVGKSR